jgi:hypothetical protein
MGGWISSIRPGQCQLDIGVESALFFEGSWFDQSISRMKKRCCFSRLIAVSALALFFAEWPLAAAILPAGFTETQFGSNVGSDPGAA